MYGRVQLKVFDTNGRLVSILLDEEQTPGHHVLRWHGKDNNGNDLPSGLYLIQGEFNQGFFRKKMILVR